MRAASEEIYNPFCDISVFPHHNASFARYTLLCVLLDFASCFSLAGLANFQFLSHSFRICRCTTKHLHQHVFPLSFPGRCHPSGFCQRPREDLTACPLLGGQARHCASHRCPVSLQNQQWVYRFPDEQHESWGRADTQAQWFSNPRWW